MNWCRNNRYIKRHATTEQKRLIAMAGVRARELKRLAAEPRVYMPFSHKIAGYIISGRCQFDGHFVEQTTVLVDSGNSRSDSFQAIVDGVNVLENHGIHYWHEMHAKAMQQHFLTE